MGANDAPSNAGFPQASAEMGRPLCPYPQRPASCRYGTRWLDGDAIGETPREGREPPDTTSPPTRRGA